MKSLRQIFKGFAHQLYPKPVRGLTILCGARGANSFSASSSSRRWGFLLSSIHLALMKVFCRAARC
jgi:hypothetical protein